MSISTLRIDFDAVSAAVDFLTTTAEDLLAADEPDEADRVTTMAEAVTGMQAQMVALYDAVWQVSA